ncbi:hypothetical protein F2P81_004217 [Scophthalmus maximus]|uniref:Uncharacterized protein n=1 Tax=Scophthalmus maximus TaxID=52904 RepID=A0A6A4TGI0_SCOMX|nr:hypothetical protein F2P81_004217 [Scophthalmus maximus]
MKTQSTQDGTQHTPSTLAPISASSSASLGGDEWGYFYFLCRGMEMNNCESLPRRLRVSGDRRMCTSFNCSDEAVEPGGGILQGDEVMDN